MQNPKDQTSLFNRRLGLDPEKFLKSIRQEFSGIKTGIDKIDRQLLGLAGFVGIIGEPKACKSTLALQIAAHNACEGNPVYFIDQENGRARLARRLLCLLTGSTWSEIKFMDRLSETYEKLSRLPLYFHFGSVDISDVTVAVDAMIEAHPGKRAIVVVDSLQGVARNLADMRISIDQWLLDLDGLKLKHDGLLTVIIICEKKRGAYGMASIDAAKESGRIEYKLEQQLDLRNQNGQIILECTLNRDGPKGMHVSLTKVLKNPANENSFTFQLAEEETLNV